MALESSGDWYPTRNGHRNGRRLGVVLQAAAPRIVALEGQVADLRRVFYRAQQWIMVVLDQVISRVVID